MTAADVSRVVPATSSAGVMCGFAALAFAIRSRCAERMASSRLYRTKFSARHLSGRNISTTDSSKYAMADSPTQPIRIINSPKIKVGVLLIIQVSTGALPRCFHNERRPSGRRRNFGCPRIRSARVLPCNSTARHRARRRYKRMRLEG